MTASYEGLDEEKELETIPLVINNSNVNVVSDSDIQAKMTLQAIRIVFLIRTSMTK